MELQSFIQSGLLESYVLGQCTDEERLLVERMAREHPSVKTELAAIEAALEQYALGHAIAPPTGLKERILQQLDVPNQAPAEQPVAPPGAAGSSGRLFGYLSAFLAVTVLAFAYQLIALHTENTSLQNQLAVLQKDFDDCSKRSDHNREIADLLFFHDSKPVELKLKDSPKPALLVYNNKVRHETILELPGTDHPQPNKYWQAWAMIDGKPVSIGMVHVEKPGGWQVLEYKDNAAAFAVSEEDKPEGNPTPTKVLMVGKAL
jgi:hypothetical protein